MRPSRAQLVLLSMAASGLLPLQAQTTFYTAIRNNDLAGLRQLVKKSGPNAGDSRHTSPLMYAATLGSLDAMKLLVEAGADVNSANDFGATPLMWCAGDLAKARYLLFKGADVKARSKVGRTPVMIAANCDGSVEIARLMIEKGADVIDVVGVAAINNDVILLQPGRKIFERAVHDSRRQHQPHRAGRFQLANEVLERTGANRALAGQLFDAAGIVVKYHALLSISYQTATHIGAHAH